MFLSASILPSLISLAILALCGWIIGKLWQTESQRVSFGKKLRVGLLCTPGVEATEFQDLHKSLIRDLHSFGLQTWLSVSVVRPQFPAGAGEFNLLSQTYPHSAELLMRMGRYDVMITLVPLQQAGSYQIEFSFPHRKGEDLSPGALGCPTLGPFSEEGKGGKTVLLFSCLLDLLRESDPDRDRGQVLQRLQAIFRIYQEDLYRDARPEFLFSLVRFDAWLDTQLGNSGDDAVAIRKARDTLEFLCGHRTGRLSRFEQVRALSNLAHVYCCLGRLHGRVEDYERSIDRAREAGGLLAPRDEHGIRGGLLNLIAQVQAELGAKQIDHRRRLESVQTRLTALGELKISGLEEKHARTKWALAKTYLDVDENDASDHYLHLAIDTLKSLGGNSLSPRLFHHRLWEQLGDCYVRLGERQARAKWFISAATAYEKAVALVWRWGDGNDLRRLQVKQMNSWLWQRELDKSKAAEISPPINLADPRFLQFSERDTIDDPEHGEFLYLYGSSLLRNRETKSDRELLNRFAMVLADSIDQKISISDRLQRRRSLELLADISMTLARNTSDKAARRAGYLQALDAFDRTLADLHEFRERQGWIEMHFKRGMCAKAALDAQIFEPQGMEWERLSATARHSFDRVIAYLDTELFARKFSRAQFARAEIISDVEHDVGSGRDNDFAAEALDILEQSINILVPDQRSTEQAISWGRMADLLRNHEISGDLRHDLKRSVSAYRQAVRILSNGLSEAGENKAILKCYVQNLARTETVLKNLKSEHRRYM